MFAETNVKKRKGAKLSVVEPTIEDTVAEEPLESEGLITEEHTLDGGSGTPGTTNSRQDLLAPQSNGHDPTRISDGTFESLKFLEVVAHKVKDEVEEVAHKIYEAGWRLVQHAHLPEWMKDNEFLHDGHRPELRSFSQCFKSIFRIHTETGNIWSHLLGMVAFIGITAYFMSRPSSEVHWQEKAVFAAFFFGAITCLGFSWIFHTVCCHSSDVGKLFNKLDYCGISVLTVGSFVPWLYYCFYCRLWPKVIYLALIFVLGTMCTIVSLLDKFQFPRYRPVRAGMFIALGLSGVIPAMHFVITDGFHSAIYNASLGWLILMAFCYIFGAVIYAVRIPERIWPGKFDIWFHSHQIFHLCVLAGAMVHYHGITQIANYRLSSGDCMEVVSLGPD